MIMVLDVQGFLILESKQFVVKELAIFDGERLGHYVFEPPCSYSDLSKSTKRQVKWLENYHHGIMFHEGHVPLYKVSSILDKHLSDVDTVYVKGHQKYLFVKNFSPHTKVVDLGQSLVITNVSLNKPNCFYHSNDLCICAINNCKLLYESIKENIE